MPDPNPEASPTRPDADAIVFIGGGNMARSLIGGMIERGTPPAAIRVAEPFAETAAALARDFGIEVGSDNRTAVRCGGTVVLAVKPQVLRAVCAELSEALPLDALVISIAAGITAGQIDRWLGGERAVVRSMPNTPALLGAGATGLYANRRCTEAQRQRAETLLGTVGITVRIDDEAQMDVVTALSGSGPAYAFLLAEAMQAGAVAQGLPPEAAATLAAQTLYGAARMLVEAGEPAATLRARVTSPGGTTQAAIESLQAQGFEAMLTNAIAAATQRGRQLAQAAEEPR